MVYVSPKNSSSSVASITQRTMTNQWWEYGRGPDDREWLETVDYVKGERFEAGATVPKRATNLAAMRSWHTRK